MPVSRWSVVLFALLLLGVPGPASAQTDQDLQRLNVEWREAYDAKKWDEAQKLSARLIALEPENPIHPYNFACVLALGGEKEKALAWLERSADLGFPDAELFATDPDLASLRDTEVFKKSLAMIRGRIERRRGEFAKALEKSPIKVVLPPRYDEMEKAKVIIALHPFGGTPDWIVRQWREVAAEQGAIIIAPQAVYRQGEGFQWGSVDEAEKVFERAFAVMGSLKADRDRVVLTGFSQGAYMAFNLGMKHCEKFVGVIPVGGQYDPRFARPSGSSAKPKYVLLVGGEDRVVGSNRAAAEQYQAAGISVHLEVYPGLGHAFPENRAQELTQALGKIWK